MFNFPRLVILVDCNLTEGILLCLSCN